MSKVKKPKTAITPTREDNFAEWYQQVIRAADLAETSPVRGCMVIKPWGYAIWERMQQALDAKFKATGHQNAYFPLFIPLSFFEKEAEHVEGFAKECAVVTHHRLEPDPDGGLKPGGELEEPLVVRPTSETIIGASFSRWVQSYRDLPLLINQWANIVRWEMRTRMFLRTSEFLWQEGHTAHATREEAVDETMQMLQVYADFAETWIGMPVIPGEKTEGERFPGALQTYCIEAMMQDRKALQAGTSHFLGQNFARASDITFSDESGNQAHAWTTSWGVSTRLVGGLIMTHSDDDGLVCPPMLAPIQIVILPIIHKAKEPQAVMDYCQGIAKALRERSYGGEPIRVEVDDRDIRGGDKTWQHIKRGVPLRLEIGPRDMENEAVFMARRDQSARDKQTVGRAEIITTANKLLGEIQDALTTKARTYRDENTREIDNQDDFYAYFTPERNDPNAPPPIHGGFAWTHFCGDVEVENKIKDDLAVTVRCIPLEGGGDPGTCPFTGKPSPQRVVWAKSY